MPKNPLFSSYRQGENRVTASMLAVFERVDLAVVEELLSAAIEESSLRLVSLSNQVARSTAPEAVPDAEIAGSFQYLFEVKTERNALHRSQLEGHLNHFQDYFRDKRLFVVTPDPERPAVIQDLGDQRVVWFNFESLANALQRLLSEQAADLSEQTRLLLRELLGLFEADGLLDYEDVVVVAARFAYAEYLKRSIYICQSGRSFRDGVTHIAFYSDGEINQRSPEFSTAGTTCS